MPGSATNRLRSIHAKSTTVRQLPAGRGDGPTKRATMRDQWHASTRHSYAVLPGSANYRLRSGHANSTTVRQLSRGRGTDTTVLRTRTWRLVSRSAPRNLEIGTSKFDPFIAVGTGITPRPPHRSVQALLRHTALTLSG